MNCVAARPRSVFLAILFLMQSAISFGQTVAPVKLPKKQIRVIRTECLVAATEAKRAALTHSLSEPHARELWSRISENNNTAGAMFFLQIPFNQDVLNNGAAPSGLGWRSEFLDSLTPTGNQRHHFGFYYFVGAAGGINSSIAGLGALINDMNDTLTNNVGDLMLAGAARNLGEVSRANGVTTGIGKQVKNGFCTP